MTDQGVREGEVFAVGELLVDVGNRLLTRSGTLVPLPPKTFELLVTLVRRAPGVVTRQELLDSVWPNEIVNDEALTQRLMLLRRALGDDPKNPAYIASVPRWGYRLVAPVHRVDAATGTPAAARHEEPGPPPVDPGQPLTRHRMRPRALLWLIAALVAVAAAVTIYLARDRATPADSLAILPFATGGADAGAEVLADGIRETLTNALSRVPRLRVIAASSTSRYKSVPADPQKVGRELGVRAVVTGRLVQRGETLAVSAELVSVADGTQLWGRRFARPASDILVLQEDLAAEIAQQLRARLATTGDGALRTRYTDDVEAYRLYLKGRYQWNKRTVQGFSAAIENFRKAIEADPTYALAFAGLADCYALLGAAEYGALPPRETLPRARAAAARALELDPTLAEAHASLGLVQRTFDWDRSAAERSFRRAIELAPAYATAHQWYGEMLAETGRPSEAEVEIRRALELDPLSLVISADLGLFAYYAREYEQAIASYRATLGMEQRFVPARLGLALAYTQEGRHTEALAELAEARAIAAGEPAVLAATAFVLGRAGRTAEARAIADELQRLEAKRYVPAYYDAGVYIGLGDRDAAFSWLAKACEQRCSLLGALTVDPAFDPLRGDERFAAILRCAGHSGS
ncbi:MAG: winged helix-turn-helix domain-containing protein [Acidobacteria bacterium]|nr:winged helix-turn-helix domain-containing protein [Acidobacteriota bacterium]